MSNSLSSLTSAVGAVGNVGNTSNGIANSGFSSPGFPSQTDIQGLPDAAPNWLWTLDIQHPTLSSLQNIYVMEIDLPLQTIMPEPRFRCGQEYFFPVKVAISSLNVIFYETVNYDITQYLNAWHNLVRNQTNGLFGLPTSYMANGLLTLYDYLGNANLQITVEGLWPTSRGHFAMNYHGSGQTLISCEFSVNNSILGASSINPSINNSSGALTSAPSSTSTNSMSQSEPTFASYGGAQPSSSTISAPAGGSQGYAGVQGLPGTQSGPAVSAPAVAPAGGSQGFAGVQGAPGSPSGPPVSPPEPEPVGF